MITEGYVLHTYGGEAYLRHAVASVTTLRRYDRKRPVALYCTKSQIEILERTGLAQQFTLIKHLPRSNRSIKGFKHHVHKFKPWKRALYIDCDVIWCRNPDPLWTQLSVYPFTATGLERADFYFGGPKNAAVILEFLRNRRGRTLTRFGLTHLPRIQAGMIYAADPEVTQSVCELAAHFHSRSSETHFRTRLLEGRSEESCEWGIAMAMSKMGLPVYNWYQGANSPQLDYIPGMTEHTEDFEDVFCEYYTDRFIYEIRGIKDPGIRQFCIRLASAILRRRDRMMVTPFILHFSWLHAKQPFHDFADRVWEEMASATTP
ncbi:MAG: hypothetical protein OXE92_01430 [Bacteroidetes bacterium]|nr:hypothetical protein [Bacteroidota bacterium]MCY4204368.1 hypothetical protein [Bacteroidota bacterium]